MKVTTEEFEFVHNGLKMLRAQHRIYGDHCAEMGRNEEAAEEARKVGAITALLIRFIDEADDS